MDKAKAMPGILPDLPIEVHPFPPFLPENARVLVLGTFPPAEGKRAMDFYYPNFQNDMWRILGIIYFQDPDHFRRGTEKPLTRIRSGHSSQRPASPWVPRCCVPSGKRETPRTNSFTSWKRRTWVPCCPGCPHCRRLVTTGEKATEIVLHQCTEPPKLPRTNTTVPIRLGGKRYELTRLPSSSRAYPMKLEKKAECYKKGLTL